MMIKERQGICWSTRDEKLRTSEPSHEIMALVILRKLILQMHMRSHPMGLDVWSLVGPSCTNSEGSGETARMRRLA